MLSEKNVQQKIVEWKQLVINVLDRLKPISDKYNLLELELISMPGWLDDGYSEAIEIKRNSIEEQKETLVNTKFNILDKEKEALVYFSNNYLSVKNEEGFWLFLSETVDEICDNGNLFPKSWMLFHLSLYITSPSETKYSKRIKDLGSPIAYLKELCLSLPDDYEKYLSDKEKEKSEKDELDAIKTSNKGEIKLILDENLIDATNKASLMNSPRTLLKMYELVVEKANKQSAKLDQLGADEWLDFSKKLSEKYKMANNQYNLVEVIVLEKNESVDSPGHALISITNSKNEKIYYDNNKCFSSVVTLTEFEYKEKYSNRKALVKNFVINQTEHNNTIDYLNQIIGKEYDILTFNCVQFANEILCCLRNIEMKNLFMLSELEGLNISGGFIEQIYCGYIEKTQQSKSVGYFS